MAPETTDVLIVGAGPVGLLTAIGLFQQGVDSIVLEKRERDVQATFGRATTLFPRSLELLEQLYVTKDLIQEGFVARSSLNYNNGQRISNRGWGAMFDHLKTSFHDYVLNIRQCHSEDVFRARYERYGKSVRYGWELISYVIDTSLNDGYNITAILQHRSKGRVQVRSKFLLGADGGSSLVRRLSDIPLDSESTTYEWIRIDGKLATDMPGADLGFASIETSHHGNVLWVKLERDAHRIGFALTPALLAKYPGGITEEEAVKEAVECMRPFKLDVERLDWWTHYKIKQSVARSLQKDTYVLLAGDAAHIHSSGFAQGMNTGIHDATNLVWKLAGTIKGWYKPSVLQTYASERRAAAMKLIQIDTEASALISGDIPPRFQALGSSVDEVLNKVWLENIGFNLGLGITYANSVLDQVTMDSSLASGVRCPDALVRRVGVKVPLRLYDALLDDGATGRWSILVFAGNPALTCNRFADLKDQLEHLASRHEGMRHSEYGVDQTTGAIVIIRPDHILGFAVSLDQGCKVADYFNQFVN
uniref:FAD-binding domain-containing protein n=1 Tax=Bionectria ochroleuca TaxID=29856 RepID=A0A8H7NPN7_BIOOC